MRVRYRSRVVVAFSIFTFSILPTLHPAIARAETLHIAGDTNGFICNVADPGIGGITHVYVLLKYTTGATGVAFRAPVPASSGYLFIGSSTPWTPNGNVESGITVGFGLCQTGSVTVLDMLLVKASSGVPCSYVRALPFPGYESVVYTDCSFVEHAAITYAGAVLNSDGTPSCMAPPADNPSPADGATGVSLVPTLSYSFIPPECGDISGRDDTLYLGTSSNPPSLGIVGDPPHQVGPLQPSTKYYWKVKIRALGSETVSPVWSFTTAAPVAVTPSTWGAIKALYR